MLIKVVILEHTQIEYTVYKLNARKYTQNFNENDEQNLKNNKQEQVYKILGKW